MFTQLLKTFLRKRFGYGLKLSKIYQIFGTTLVLAPFLASPAIKKTVPQIPKTNISYAESGKEIYTARGRTFYPENHASS